MALKALMLRRSIENKKADLAKLTAKDAEMQTREADLEKSVAEVETEEQQNAVSAEIDQFETDRAAHEKSKADLLENITNPLSQISAENRWFCGHIILVFSRLCTYIYDLTLLYDQHTLSVIDCNYRTI